MKKVLAVLGLVMMFSCNSLIKTDSKTTIINSNQIKDIVSYLASDELQGRNTGSAGIEKAAVYIEDFFKNNTIKPYFKTYRDSFNVKGVTGYNVVGFIEGNDPILKNEVIILGAHYDHIGFGKKFENDSIANGANDDATGTSAVMAMAHYFAAVKSNKRSMVFALFSGEEKGLLGSKHLASKLKADGLNLYTMIEFEMIGVPMKDKDYTAYITGFDLSNMAGKINEYTNSQLVGLLPKAKEYKLFYRSDNYSFYKEFNKPCQTISTFDFTNYDFYHHVKDEANQMDYEFMAGLINKVIPAVEMMSNTPTKEIQMNNE